MPSDDLILNVRQISQYPPAAYTTFQDNVLLQRGGLGGPYMSILSPDFVGTALAGGGLMQIGVTAPPNADSAQAFTIGLSTTLDGWWMWNGYVGGGLDLRVANGAAGLMRFDGTDGWQWFAAAAGGAGSAIAWNNVFTVDPTGQGSLVGSLYLGRDPIAPNEAATANWVGTVALAPLENLYNTATVWSVNGRTGALTLTVQDVRGAAPFYSPRFEGQPRAPTPSPGSCSNRLATTAFVHGTIAQYICGLQAASVTSFNGRTGAVVLTEDDIAAALAGATLPYAPINSPNFTGLPTAPTPAPGTADGSLATTAFVMNAVTESTTGVASFNGRTGAVTLASADLTLAGGALLTSPVFTGTPQAPTATPGTSSAQLATTAFVGAALTAALIAYAPVNSPVFSGVPGAPTAPLNSNTTQIATCAFVMNQLTAIDAGVTTFNGRSGAVSLIGNDVSAAGGALLVSPVFTGTPQAPTASPGTSTGQLATTAFVAAALAAVAGVTSFNGRAGSVTLSSADLTSAGGALLSSPIFTGTPTAPTAAPATSTTQLATCAFVTAAVAASVVSFNGRSGAVALTLADVTGVGGAPIASPTFTGVPAGPTPAPATATTQLATTAFVRTGVSDGSQAAAGTLGEVLTASGGGGQIIATTPTTLAVLSLTPGDWDVMARAVFTPSGPPSSIGAVIVGCSNVNGAFQTTGDSGMQTLLAAAFNVSSNMIVNSGTARYNVSAPTTVYCVGQINYTGGSVTATGLIRARRIR